MHFIDEATITVRSGDGGRGCVSFRREKFVPMGGPDGGTGGNGGSVLLVASPHLSTLLDFRYRNLHKAKRGQHGKGKNMTGKCGPDLQVAVPMGTIVYDAETGETLADLTKAGETYLAAAGGRGGRGNLSFTSSMNQAPDNAEPGEPGIERRLRLELKLIARIGLVGLPNAGKSTLLSRISRAKPKIADYPFTTLSPVLGVVSHRDEEFVVADLPGPDRGSAPGRGAGAPVPETRGADGGAGPRARRGAGARPDRRRRTGPSAMKWSGSSRGSRAGPRCSSSTRWTSRGRAPTRNAPWRRSGILRKASASSPPPPGRGSPPSSTCFSFSEGGSLNDA